MQTYRLRRLRKNRLIRNWVAEAELSLKNLIMPYFVIGGKNKKEEIKSMPGVWRISLDNLLKDIEGVYKRGIPAILLFGVITEQKHRAKSLKPQTEVDSRAYSKNGIVQKVVAAIKKEFNELILITDVCLCGYSSHGHCGIIKKNTKYEIDNDATLEILAKIALSHAQAGADFVAPSAMMDRQVKTIRQALDKDGFEDVGILAYSAKYASSFYGPFREALNSAPQFGDRKTYQMDFRNSDEALREIRQDVDEGADIVMVKPALAYLDIIYRAKEKFSIPIAAYNVSGEYSIIKRYCQKIEDKKQRAEAEKKMVLEVLTSIKRAGADFIITYWAKEVAGWLRSF